MTAGRKAIAVFGAGGFGMEVAMLVEQINEREPQWEVVGFFDDGEPEGKRINGYPVLGGIDALNGWPSELHVVLALGMPQTKCAVHQKIYNPNILYPVLIHPSVILGKREYVAVGEGSIICAGTVITTNISIGRHVIVNLCCTIGHETEIGDYSSFMPTCNISGEVQIGKATYWGTGAKVINGKTIGDNAVVGAGAVVVQDLPADVTAVGVPAKVIKGPAPREAASLAAHLEPGAGFTPGPQPPHPTCLLSSSTMKPGR